MHKATHDDPLTQHLRAQAWTPTEVHICGCTPAALCVQHREIRAVEHYHPETIRR